MHALIWLACAAGCGILWILQELVGSIVAEAVGELLKWVFSPIFTPIGRFVDRLLAGPHRLAWRRGMVAVGICGLGGGMLAFFDGANRGSGAELIVGIVAAAIALVALLSLDSRVDGAPVSLGRRTAAR